MLLSQPILQYFFPGLLKTSIRTIIVMGLKFGFMQCVMNAGVTSQTVCCKFFIGAKTDQLGKHKCQSERTNASLKVHIKLLQSSLMALLPSLCYFQLYFSTPTVGQIKNMVSDRKRQNSGTVYGIERKSERERLRDG